MAEEKQGGGLPLQSSGVFAMALAVIGLIWTGPLPLLDERPISHKASDSDAGKLQDVDSRMWQDPLEVVEKEIKKASAHQHSVLVERALKNELKQVSQDEASSKENEHLAENLSSNAFNEGDARHVNNVLMLGVVIPGGPYPEEEEARRRKRYAVLSGLATLKYVPKETEHIGYIKIKKENSPEVVVPFELFENATVTPGKGVIVLWLDDSNFDTDMEQKILRIFNEASPSQVSKITYAVVGPNKSNQLKAFISESVVSQKVVVSRFSDST